MPWAWALTVLALTLTLTLTLTATLTQALNLSLIPNPPLTLTLTLTAWQLPADPNSQALAFVDGGVVHANISALQLLQSCSPAIRSQPPSTGVPPGASSIYSQVPMYKGQRKFDTVTT